jgi:hypothetical protein
MDVFRHDFDLVAHPVGLGDIVIYPGLQRDGGGGFGVVAGDHHGADAGRSATVHGRPRLLPQRVDHADESGMHEVALAGLRLVAEFLRRRHLPEG